MKKFITASFALAAIFLSLASLAQRKAGPGNGLAAKSISKPFAAPSIRSAAPASNTNRNMNSGNNGSRRDNLGADKKSLDRSGNKNLSGNKVNVDNSKKT